MFQRSEIKFRIPSRPVESGKIVFGKLLGIQERCHDDDRITAKSGMPNFDEAFTNGEKVGKCFGYPPA